MAGEKINVKKWRPKLIRISVDQKKTNQPTAQKYQRKERKILISKKTSVYHIQDY